MLQQDVESYVKDYDMYLISKKLGITYIIIFNYCQFQLIDKKIFL